MLCFIVAVVHVDVDSVLSFVTVFFFLCSLIETPFGLVSNTVLPRYRQIEVVAIQEWPIVRQHHAVKVWHLFLL